MHFIFKLSWCRQYILNRGKNSVVLFRNYLGAKRYSRVSTPHKIFWGRSMHSILVQNAMVYVLFPEILLSDLNLPHFILYLEESSNPEKTRNFTIIMKVVCKINHRNMTIFLNDIHFQTTIYILPLASVTTSCYYETVEYQRTYSSNYCC